jgi:hypothetical protein
MRVLSFYSGSSKDEAKEDAYIWIGILRKKAGSNPICLLRAPA